MDKTINVKDENNCLIISMAGDQSYVKIYDAKNQLFSHTRSKGGRELRQVVGPGKCRIESDGTIDRLKSTHIDLESHTPDRISIEEIEAATGRVLTDTSVIGERFLPAKREEITGSISGNVTDSLFIDFSGPDFDKNRLGNVVPTTEKGEISWRLRVMLMPGNVMRYIFEITNLNPDPSFIIGYRATILEFT